MDVLTRLKKKIYLHNYMWAKVGKLAAEIVGRAASAVVVYIFVRQK